MSTNWVVSYVRVRQLSRQRACRISRTVTKPRRCSCTRHSMVIWASAAYYSIRVLSSTVAITKDETFFSTPLLVKPITLPSIWSKVLWSVAMPKRERTSSTMPIIPVRRVYTKRSKCTLCHALNCSWNTRSTWTLWTKMEWLHSTVLLISVRIFIGGDILIFRIAIGHQDIVRLLLKSKAELNTKDASGWTPLHVASAHNDVELVRLLVSRGARLNATDHQGHSPLKWARETGSRDVFAYLKNQGGKEFDSSTPSASSTQRNSQRNSKKRNSSPKSPSSAAPATTQDEITSDKQAFKFPSNS